MSSPRGRSGGGGAPLPSQNHRWLAHLAASPVRPSISFETLLNGREAGRYGGHEPAKSALGTGARSWSSGGGDRRRFGNASLENNLPSWDGSGWQAGWRLLAAAAPLCARACTFMDTRPRKACDPSMESSQPQLELPQGVQLHGSSMHAGRGI